jgi:hypothetical protein
MSDTDQIHHCLNFYYIYLKKYSVDVIYDISFCTSYASGSISVRTAVVKFHTSFMPWNQICYFTALQFQNNVSVVSYELFLNLL